MDEDILKGRLRRATKAYWQKLGEEYKEDLLGAITEGLDTWFPGAELAVDPDRVPALAEDRERLWSQVNAAEFLSDAEKRALLGLAPAENKA